MGIFTLPASGGGTNRTVDFTSSSTWLCPANVYSAEFLVVGAGGGGGGADNSDNAYVSVGGGGGGGAVKLNSIPVTPGSTYTITVGAKGTGSIGTAGTNGGYSEVVLSGTTLIRSFGGQGGVGVDDPASYYYAVFTQTLAGGGGFVAWFASNATVIGSGGGSANEGSFPSENELTTEGTLGESSGGLPPLGLYGFGSGGGGGASSNNALEGYIGAAPFGAGKGAVHSAVSVATNTAGENATLAGCGGGGAASSLSTTGAAGGNGADGLVRITYFG